MTTPAIIKIALKNIDGRYGVYNFYLKHNSTKFK